MSKFYGQFFKVFTLLVGLYASAECATLEAFGFKCEVVRRKAVAAAPMDVSSFDWFLNPRNGNVLIKSASGEIAATIYFSRYDRSLRAILNIPNNTPVELLSIKDILSAKKWVITQAQNYGIALART